MKEKIESQYNNNFTGNLRENDYNVTVCKIRRIYKS